MKLSWWVDTSGNFNGNIGDRMLKIFSMLRSFASQGIEFLTRNVNIFGQDVSMWVIFTGGLIVTLLLSIVLKKVI